MEGIQCISGSVPLVSGKVSYIMLSSTRTLTVQLGLVLMEGYQVTSDSIPAMYGKVISISLPLGN